MAMAKKLNPFSHAWLPYASGSLAAVVMLILLYFGFSFQQKASAQAFVVRGFDVSHHQGNIQWSKISPHTFQFVYLKATEGGDFKDSKFQDNWLQARERGFHVGAYHFFRLCSNGKIQAQNFIETVPKKANALPPVIDLEYDNQCINTHTREQLIEEIQVMHDLLKKHYGQQPIFYVSTRFYQIVLTGYFKQTPLWIRSYQGEPQLADLRGWTFWQHTNKGRIAGIDQPVDLNVFGGSQQEWQDFVQHHLHQEKP